MGRLENAIGWYHSHPGYGCWLSGIDVGTQMVNQQFQEPFVAIVVSIHENEETFSLLSYFHFSKIKMKLHIQAYNYALVSVTVLFNGTGLC